MVQQKRRKPRKTARFLNMLLLVFAFLVVFEGRLIINIASKGGINKQVDEQLNEIFSSSDFQNQDEATADRKRSAAICRTFLTRSYSTRSLSLRRILS